MTARCKSTKLRFRRADPAGLHETKEHIFHMFIRTTPFLSFNAPAARRLTLAFVASAIALGALAQTPPTWNSGTTYTAGNIVVGADSNIYRAVYTSLSHAPSTDAGGYWELFHTIVPTTLDVGVKQRFSTIEAALKFIRQATIPANAEVTISIITTDGAFSESPAAAINLDHANGANIRIVGSKAASCTINCGSANGFVIDSGHSFGVIANVTVKNTGMLSSNALNVTDGATLHAIGCVLQGFPTALQVDGDAKLYCANLGVSGFSYGAAVTNGGYLDVSGCSFDGGGKAGIGFYATDKSFIKAAGCTVTNINGFGIEASLGSEVNMQSATVTHCKYGVNSSNHGTVNAQFATVQYCGTGFVAALSSFINAMSVTLGNNTVDYSLYAALLSGSSQTNNLSSDGSLIAT